MTPRSILVAILAGIGGVALGAGVTYVLLKERLGATPPAQGDPGMPYSGADPPKELEVLAPNIGRWKITEKQHGVRFKGGATATGEVTSQWGLNRHCLRADGHLVRDVEGKKLRVEFATFITYDRANKLYRRWLYSSEGFIAEMEGDWDAASSTMTWRPTTPLPNTSISATLVLKGDRTEFHVRHTRDDGTVLLDLESIGERLP